MYRSSLKRNVTFTVTPRTEDEKLTPVNPVTIAVVLQGMLEEGDVRNRSELARRAGMTRARVTQLLNLLALPCEIQEHILVLPNDKASFFTERRLRPLTQLATRDKQLRAFRLMQDTSGFR